MSNLETNLEYLVAQGMMAPTQAETVRSGKLSSAYAMAHADGEPQNQALRADRGGRTVWFHDADRPAAEAARRVEQIPDDTTDLLLVGVRLGYELQAALRHRPALQQIAVMEVEPALVREALVRVRLRDFSGVRFYFWTGDVTEINLMELKKFFFKPNPQLLQAGQSRF